MSLRPESNRRPLLYESIALPTELRRQFLLKFKKTKGFLYGGEFISSTEKKL